WLEIQTGVEYTVHIRMDGGAGVLDRKMRGMYNASGSPALITTVDANFLVDFAKYNRVDFYNSRWMPMTALSLDGTAAAVMQLFQCQESHGGPKPQNVWTTQ
ncbi:hypothetical protein, partial [Reyranella sp.]|uniref:hypothetical protein n=1 Tax=Reyranella sp. TaxID=1929291 RepID=UPI002F92385A